MLVSGQGPGRPDATALCSSPAWQRDLLPLPPQVRGGRADPGQVREDSEALCLRPPGHWSQLPGQEVPGDAQVCLLTLLLPLILRLMSLQKKRADGEETIHSASSLSQSHGQLLLLQPTQRSNMVVTVFEGQRLGPSNWGWEVNHWGSKWFLGETCFYTTQWYL